MKDARQPVWKDAFLLQLWCDHCETGYLFVYTYPGLEPYAICRLCMESYAPEHLRNIEGGYIR